MGEIELRPWRAEGAAALAALCGAADRRFLSDRLPNPYTAADAEFWLRRVLEKNGFAQEGLLRNAVCKDGALQDLAVYGKLRPDV